MDGNADVNNIVVAGAPPVRLAIPWAKAVTPSGAPFTLLNRTTQSCLQVTSEADAMSFCPNALITTGAVRSAVLSTDIGRLMNPPSCIAPPFEVWAATFRVS